MKKAKLLSLLLALSLIVSFAVPGSLAAETNEGGGQTSSGMVYSKTAVPDGYGGYIITLEAYATGSKVITQVTEDVPTDIVLVLDQSGSMDETMSVTGFLAYVNQSNSYLYNRRHNDNTGYGVTRNLYYKLSESSYVEVSVARNQIPIYTLIEQNGQNQANSYYYTNSNNLYALINGDYQQVTVTCETTDSGWFWADYKYTYTVNGTVIHTSDNDAASDIPGFTGVEGNKLYLRGTDYEYTYTYTVDNVTQTIGTSVGADTQPSDFTLYQSYTNGSVSRLSALKSTVASFTNSVASKTVGADGIEGTTDDVHHRIAVVGYASGTPADNPWRNSEVFIGATQYNYNSNASAYYASAFQDMATTAGRNNISASIGALDADGATYTNLGMEMANGILQANPVPEGQRRNRVVIVFTDGIPGRTGYSETVANAALTQGTAIKNGGTTIYAIGVFGGADAGSTGNQNGNDTQKANWFMQQLSSGNGTPNSGYYLSAADAGTLGGIFQQISQNIETGGTSTTLTEETVIKDIIAPAFTLPADATASDITLETWKCTGVGVDGEYTWSINSDAMGATANIGSTDETYPTTSNNQVNVTGFDFAENYVGTVTENGYVTGYRGHKLVISFTVTPRPGFFGGNGVFTNDSAGIYENSSSTTPILTFDRPQVDVPLAEPVVTVPDANVYLGAYYSQTVPEDAVKMGATVTIGGCDIDFSKANDPNEPYGLQPWQVEYVNISIEATTEGNNGSFENIQEDISYTVTVTVSPKTPGTSGDQSETASGQGTIHVFKPKLTFEDSDVWYGGAMPDDFNDNLTNETWINHDGSKTHKDQGVEMLNTEPELTLSYTPGITGATVNTKQDVPVKVDVTMPIGDTATNINSDTTFEHLQCNAMTCGWDNLTPAPSDGNPAFLLHVNTFTLTITKTGGDNEPYVFTILKDGEKYTEASITGNGNITISELPIGTYSIVEDTGWSWRFNPSYGGTAELSETNPTATLTCTNSISENKWLNGFSEVMRNIFGGNNQ